VLGGLVMTGIAFGGGLGNAGAPRFAKVQTVLFIAPYAFFAGMSGKPGMIVILLQAPLWLIGIYTLIGRAHATHAQLIRAQRLTEHLAYHDALTSLPNRARLMECLAKECEHVPQPTDRSSYVLYLDLDGFKAVNDTLGHGAGDELLRAVAARFQQFMRPCDTFGRLGGDEFAAILNCMTAAEVEDVGTRLIAAAKEPFELAGLPPITIGVSIGGTDITTPPDVRQTLHAADTMLYAAKHAGKGTLRLATRVGCSDHF
jgi:diguanylate cyclase (GGDEF)-like protein